MQTCVTHTVICQVILFIFFHVKIGKPESVAAVPRGYLNRSPEFLRRMLKLADKDACKAKTAEAVARGPHFKARKQGQ